LFRDWPFAGCSVGIQVPMIIAGLYLSGYDRRRSKRPLAARQAWLRARSGVDAGYLNRSVAAWLATSKIRRLAQRKISDRRAGGHVGHGGCSFRFLSGIWRVKPLLLALGV